jgi:hypothetical protein
VQQARFFNPGCGFGTTYHSQRIVLVGNPLSCNALSPQSVAAATGFSAVVENASISPGWARILAILKKVQMTALTS